MKRFLLFLALPFALLSQPATVPIAPQFGGTGVANASTSTITLGAALITTGTGVPTLAFGSSNATYTFPGSSTALAPYCGTGVCVSSGTAWLTSLAYTGSGGLVLPSLTASGATGYGFQVAAPTGATANYAGVFTGGNVGIGTMSPNYLLEVDSSSSGSRVTGLMLKNLGNTNNSAISLDFSDEPSNLATSRINVTRLSSVTGATTFDIQTFVPFGPGMTSRLFIDSTGNVGIGTTSPGAKLDVTGNGSALVGRFYDQTASTGLTQVIIRDGAGQSTTPQLQGEVNGGTVDWSITGAGAASFATMVATAAAPTVAASQIGYGSTTAAATSCGTITLAAGCVVINVAGTPRYIPYF